MPEYDKTHGTYYIKDAGGASSLTVDQALSDTSYNPISNKATTEQLAGTTTGTFEPAAIAASAHSVGEYFMWIGQFVKTTTAIAIGDTISLNTNVQTTNVAAVLSELNSNKVNSDFSGTYTAYGVWSSIGWSSNYVAIPFYDAHLHNITVTRISGYDGEADYSIDLNTTAVTLEYRAKTCFLVRVWYSPRTLVGRVTMIEFTATKK